MPTHQLHRYLLWPLLLLSHVLAASLLAWHLLAQVDFGYPLAHSALSIDEHIERFGPQNRYKEGFGQTDRDEHLRLFGEIARAIQNGGEGLADIRYTRPDGSRKALMREPEVVHLQDVSRLVGHYYRAGLTAAALLAALGSYAWYRRLVPPSGRRIAAGTVGLLGAGALGLWLAGPTRVFYLLHDYAFPADHPWFFYYQDSLMTTLMKAPDLFGFIGAELLVLTLLLWAGSAFWLRWLFIRRATA